MNTLFHRAIYWLAIILLVAGCNSGDSPDDPGVPLVQVQTLRNGSLPTELVVSAEVRALNRASVNPSTSGMVEVVLPQEGDRVSQGQPVIWLKNPSLKAQIREQQASLESARASEQQARANLRITQAEVENEVAQAKSQVQQAEIAVEQAQTEVDSAKNAVERKTPLYQEKVIALTELEQARLSWEIKKDELRTARSKLESAQSSLANAKKGTNKVDLQEAQLSVAIAEVRKSQAALASVQDQVDETVLKAPISGVVVSRNVNPGQSVEPGQAALLTIVNNKDLEVQAPVDQRYALNLRPGLEATMTSLIHPEKKWTITLKETVPSSDAQTNTVIARFRFTEPPAQALVDGTPVQLRLLLGETKGVLIPLEAVHGSASIGKFAAVVNNNVIDRRAVNPLMKNEAHVLVSTSDFQEGEQVVLEGGERLTEGQRVKVKP